VLSPHRLRLNEGLELRKKKRAGLLLLRKPVVRAPATKSRSNRRPALFFPRKRAGLLLPVVRAPATKSPRSRLRLGRCNCP